MGSSVICSCYFSPNHSPHRFSNELQVLESALWSISTLADQLLIAGDFNAKATLWGAPRNDSRGNLLLDFANLNDLNNANCGGIPSISIHPFHWIIPHRAEPSDQCGKGGANRGSPTGAVVGPRYGTLSTTPFWKLPPARARSY